ncbi:DNA gyrase/topoisomerase IV, subunit A [Tenacibaculum phage PTm1]|uniref:DNA topoisomerase (ATP-hydrolyzing) n=2 Tax=Shirahamavirus PTm1 TaxID=2846435 RepID=A0A5S9BZ43_9CAUD|nr:DNA gyrase/topoisomerase IV, subunit A [Tenacibaculum phage PTm1]BBI90591.1 DNA gyrase/topoisomerase IV, subunit A [Tenacibaculum phage PTm1]BBI90899.1 DNA gyrase/topoisomerase IV, subunit A [Tenacibaculum phage PTm5]
MEHKYEDGQKIEPKYYLPLIPIALTKRTSGMGLGYKYESSISYCPLSIIDACISHLKKSKKVSQLLPYIKGYTGNYKFSEDGRVWASAKYVHKGSKITVTELVPSVTFEKYEEILDKAKANEHILDWENNSKDDNIEYVIKGNTSTFDKLFKSGRIYSLLKLGEYFKRPTLTMLDEFGKVIEFDTVEEILRYFTDFRLRMYDKTKESKITTLQNEIQHKNHIIKFIELYLNGKIKLDKNTPIEKTISVLDKHKLPHFVLDIKIRKLTKEEYNKLKGEVSDLENQLKRVKNTPNLKMYLEDLHNLKKDLKNDFSKINNYENE